MTDSLARRTAAQLESGSPRLAKRRALVGFDGFVDTILHVVKTRQSPTKYERYGSMVEWSERIAAASGVSANFEFVQQLVKLGGNGPIMADALDSLGFPVTYIGCLGKPALHPVFADFAKRAKVFSLAEPGRTDALEFEDGKLMCGKNEPLREVNWRNLIAHLPERTLVKLFEASDLIAMVNWTMLTELTGVLRKLLTRVLPKLTGPRRCVFFDLADPAKRSRADLLAILRIISRYESHARVILGMNLGEARQVGGVLGLGEIEETHGTVAHAAARIRERMRVDTVVIHPVHFAAAADATGAAHVVGQFCARPKITTGAGDLFNAGFCLGRLLALDLAASLQSAVAASGWYVRSGKSPKIADLVRFLRSLRCKYTG